MGNSSPEVQNTEEASPSNEDRMFGFMDQMIKHEQTRALHQDKRDEEFKANVITMLASLEKNVIGAVNDASGRVTNRIAGAALVLIIISRLIDYAMLTDRDFTGSAASNGDGVSAQVSVEKPAPVKEQAKD